MDCEHSFKHQASLEVQGLIYDIFYCARCLKNVKKERPCPKDIETWKSEAQNSVVGSSNDKC